VRVVEPGSCAGFAAQSLPELGVTGQRGSEHLDSHMAIEDVVSGPPDRAHSTRADRVQEQITVR
jgi:hypothetical protein